MRCLSLLFLSASLALPVFAQTDARPVRAIAFGAHPDDAELQTAGTAYLWAQDGAEVKFVAATNGDVGHFDMAGGELALRRRDEVLACARILGITTEVLDIHDGELMPTLENRKTFARLIRDWQADVVFSHRRYDYHADHRYVGVLAEDAAVLVGAGFYTPYSPRVERPPIFLHYYDRFTKPYPFQPDLVVGIDDAVEKKLACVRAMPSQFADHGSWSFQHRPDAPETQEERLELIIERMKRRFADMADRYRDRLIQLYGEEKGRGIKYAEAFEICQYGRQPTIEELKELFPTF